MAMPHKAAISAGAAAAVSSSLLRGVHQTYCTTNNRPWVYPSFPPFFLAIRFFLLPFSDSAEAPEPEKGNDYDLGKRRKGKGYTVIDAAAAAAEGLYFQPPDLVSQGGKRGFRVNLACGSKGRAMNGLICAAFFHPTPSSFLNLG